MTLCGELKHLVIRFLFHFLYLYRFFLYIYVLYRYSTKLHKWMACSTMGWQCKCEIWLREFVNTLPLKM